MNQSSTNHRDEYRDVFRTVIEYYKETKVTHGTNGSLDYEEACDDAEGPQNCSRLIRPNMSDFISDVELAAKRSLSSTLLARFKAVYVDQTLFEDVLTKEERQTIEKQVGRIFKQRKIFPLFQYFKPRDLR